MPASETICGSTHHYLVSVRGSRWKETNLVMFTVYVDDSGTRKNHKIAVATALVVPGENVPKLEAAWGDFKRAEGFSSFHASPCNARDIDSEFARWSRSKVDRVFAGVMHLSRAFGAAAISASVKKSYFDVVVPTEYRRYVYTRHYSWCVSHVMAYLERWKQKMSCPYPFEFIFDWMDIRSPERLEIDKVMDYSERASREVGRAGEYEGHSTFRKKEGCPGLQCVDEIAWICNRYSLTKFEHEAMPPIAKLSWDYYGGDFAENGWLQAFTFTKEALIKHVEGVKSDGRTLERFDRWERQDNEKEIRVRKIQRNDQEAIRRATFRNQRKTRSGKSSEKAEEI